MRISTSSLYAFNRNIGTRLFVGEAPPELIFSGPGKVFLCSFSFPCMNSNHCYLSQILENVLCKNFFY